MDVKTALLNGKLNEEIYMKYSRMTWVIMMKHKSEAFKNFKQWKVLVENQFERKIKRLH